jgi:ABC-2 type transport system permease protein
MITALFQAELKLLLRNRTAAGMAVVMPLVLGGGMAFSGPQSWPTTIGMQLLCTLGLTVYVTVTTALTARRQDLYLKRLRTGAVSDTVVLAGVVLPAVVLGLVQSLLLLVVSSVAGAPLPQRPDLLLLALVAGSAMCCAVAIGTSGLTATAELAQITTTPFFFGLIGGALWGAAVPDGLTPLVTPGGGVAELVDAAWGGPAGHAPQAVLSLVVWTALGWGLAARSFRWDRRS